LLGRREDERVEFKESANGLKEVIPAMAMTLGGIVVCGISDSRELVGCPMSQKTLDKIKRAAHEAGVEVQMRPLLVDGQELTLVAIPEVRGRIVTTADGRLLRRIGSENQPLRGDTLARFVREREERSGEDEPIANLDQQNIDLDVLSRALNSDGRSPIRRRSVSAVARALVDLGVAEVTDASLDPQPLRAAVLLFAAEPTRYVRGASIQVVRRVGVGPGPGPVSARHELDGPVPLLLEKALRFIDSHTASHQAVVGSHRETFAEYPWRCFARRS
jgi:ATP-dependent DNA helicase RecG